MPSLFFGQYLVAKDIITAPQLLEAVSHQRAKNKLLGELAIDEKLLNEDQVKRIKAEQRKRDVLFGDAAIAMGFLDARQLNELLGIQRRARMALREAVLALGFAQPKEIETALHNYESQTQARRGGIAGFQDGPPVAWLEPLLAMTQKTILRVSNLETRVGEQAFSKPGQEVALFRWSASVRIAQPWSGEFILSAPDRLAEMLAQNASGAESVKPDADLTESSLREVLHVSARLAAQTLQSLDLRLEYDEADVPPRTLKLQTQRATTVQLASPMGVMLAVLTLA